MGTCTKRVTIKQEYGLHARPATQIVKLASKYNADISLKNVNTQKIADCKSLLTILLLGACVNTTLDIIGNGVDAEKAVTEIATYIDSSEF